MQKEETGCRCFRPAPAPCWHQRQQERQVSIWWEWKQNNIFFLPFSSSSIFGLKTYLSFFLTEHMGRMHIQLMMGNLGWRVSGSWVFFRKIPVDFNEVNSSSFLDDRQIETGGTQPFLTCMDFWPLKTFHEVSDNELTGWQLIAYVCFFFL